MHDLALLCVLSIRMGPVACPKCKSFFSSHDRQHSILLRLLKSTILQHNLILIKLAITLQLDSESGSAWQVWDPWGQEPQLGAGAVPAGCRAQ